MSRTTVGVVVAVAAVLLAGCGPTGGTSERPSVPKPSVSADFVNRLDGSTATIPLGSAVLTALTGSDEGMVFNKTDVAYENLIAGSKDLILVTYPSEEEFAMAEAAGVELDVIPVVKDALVFLANTGNPVSNLSQDQVKDIYTGRTTNWAEVGGNDAPIIPYQRQVNSGSQTLFLKLAMGDVTPMDAPTEMRPGEMSMLVDMIADYDNSSDALGFSVFYYATQMYLKDQAKLISIDSVMPSAETISDGTYPYPTFYYAVLRKDAPADSDARKVVEWMLGDEAQQLAARNNYVPLDPANILPPEPQYGYFGSTKENTTQSSGTGGTQMRSLDIEVWNPDATDSPIQCADDGQNRITSISVRGEEALSAALMQWVNEHPDGTSCYGVTVTQDFALIAGGRWDESTMGAFSITGETMTLSDFFYNSVNYIDFINQNLFNETTNTEYYNWVHGDQLYIEGEAHDPATGFTGIPNDYANFTVDVSDRELLITFTFPEGNPFFSERVTRNIFGDQITTNKVDMSLQIPSDLSPYGRFANLRWVQNLAGQVYPVLTTTSLPSSGDSTLNEKIRAAVDDHPEGGCFKAQFGVGRISLLSYANRDVCRSPSDTWGFPTLVGQWAFGTWDDSPMTVSDLPDSWHTTFPKYGFSAPYSGLVCPVGDESKCTYLSADGLVFSDDASAHSVWDDTWRIYANIVDGGSVYNVSYDRY